MLGVWNQERLLSKNSAFSVKKNIVVSVNKEEK
jgi:hypothetical protein